MSIFRSRFFLIWGVAVPLYLCWSIWSSGGDADSGANAVAGLLF
ncbi:MAG: hypothetical protein NWR47_07475 [Aestuariivirgaceae bacterium]|nr:hypothetical protein [Aestuariivirgaceae bacterium]